jgi:hypothetical protein
MNIEQKIAKGAKIRGRVGSMGTLLGGALEGRHVALTGRGGGGELAGGKGGDDEASPSKEEWG